MKTLTTTFVVIASIASVVACTHAHGQALTQTQASEPELRAKCKAEYLLKKEPPNRINGFCWLKADERLEAPPTKEWGSKQQELLYILRGTGAGW